MTLQIMNDYGHLSNLHSKVVVPIVYDNAVARAALEEYIRVFERLELLFIRQRIKALRFVFILFAFLSLLRTTKERCVLVLRERKHLFSARILRLLFRIPIVSELHEGGLPSHEQKKHHKAFQRFLDSVDGIVFTNFSQHQYLEANGYNVTPRSIVLPNGVDTQKFSQAKAAPKDSAHVIVTYTGQFTSWKNIPLLFESLAHLPSRFRLRIAGGKILEDDSRSYIAELEKKFAVEGRVEYLGFVHPNELVAHAVSGSSVLVLPLGESVVARFATSPMKLVEYMATPIPVVAVAHPSVTSLVGQDTVHLAQMDAGDFADAIRKAVGEESEAQQRRVKRTNLIAKQYDHIERARRYDSWLQEFIDSLPVRPIKRTGNEVPSR